RRGHRLAFPQRAQARAEGVSQPGESRIYYTEENGYDARITGEALVQVTQNRRQFLSGLSAAGAISAFGSGSPFAAEEPPETTTIRLGKLGSLCLAPQYTAEELLRAEGFTDVHYVTVVPGIGASQKIADGQVDFSLNFAAPLVIPIASGDPITIVAGVHAGCFELFAHAGIRRITDLQGKSIGVPTLGSGPHVFVSSMLTYVGLDPSRDVRWVTSETIRPMDLFAEGKIDAFLGFPPRAAGTARPRHRPCHRQQLDRSPVVGIFLLYAGGQRRIHPQPSDRDQARTARHPQGDRPLRRRAGARRAAAGRWRVHRPLRL